jgi:hypothetical protein
MEPGMPGFLDHTEDHHMRLYREAPTTALLIAALTAACADTAPVAPPTATPLAGGDAPLVYNMGDPFTRHVNGCGAAEFHQFDFWVGTWNVFGPSGAQAGTNDVKSLLSGCLVEENWTGAGGFRGRSMNAWDEAAGAWTQYWVDQGGLHLRLAGGLDNGTMLMSGERIGFRADGSRVIVIERIRWTPLPNGNVNQFWDESIDGGVTFPFLAFDGTYVPEADLMPAPPSTFSGCTAAPYRELDFWAGQWAVQDGEGNPVGNSDVSLDLADCLVEEDFTGMDGFRSQSFAGYDFRPAAWYRVYVDNRGVRLLLSGSLQGGEMVLTGAYPGPGQSQLQVRLTLRAETADRLVQVVETSHNGQVWKVYETLIYTR